MSIQRVDLYDRHPINAAQILDAAMRAGKAESDLVPADLRPHDQDHYGGVAAVHALASQLDLKPGDRVGDICAGMGGPSRVLAEQYGVTVIGLDFNWSRCAGAAHLNGLVGLGEAVKMVRCDAQMLPLAEGVLDAAISQEAFLHIPDKGAVLKGAFRALRPGGRLAFTDLVAGDGLTDEDRRQLAEDGMQMVSLDTPQDYRHLAEGAGFQVAVESDLSDAWRVILTERLEMYRQMGTSTTAVHGEGAHDAYMSPYEHFVGLVQQGALGGIRLVLQRPGD